MKPPQGHSKRCSIVNSNCPPYETQRCFVCFNDVLVSWLLGGGEGGGLLKLCLHFLLVVSNETCFFRQSSLRPRFLCCRFLQKQDLDAASFTSFQHACPATRSNVSLTTKCSHPTGPLCSAGPLCRLSSR